MTSEGLLFVLVLSSPYRGDDVARLKPSVEAIELAWERGGRLGISTIPPFVISDGSQSTPHVSGVGAVVVRLQFVSVGSFGISDGFRQVISGPGPEDHALSLSLTSPLTQGFWLGKVLTLTLWKSLDIVSISCITEHLPVCSFKTVLKSNNSFLTPSLN